MAVAESWNVTFGNITETNVQQLRKLNSAIFPVRYHDKFYADILSTNPDFTQFVYSNDLIVGAMCCRIEDSEFPNHKKLYIMTLGVLASWRRRGIGSKLLRRAITNLLHYPNIREIYLHVQTSNQEAAHGFCVEAKIENYYNRIEPPDCYLLQRCVEDNVP
ncbi:unnamed protein product [Choristocarpus tenellus]